MKDVALDPALLQAFLAVADLQSFTRAAAKLNRTQSAVSMQVKRLEQRLGHELFQRSTAHVALSASGESLLGYARRILAMNREAIARLGESRLEGRVRLGVMEDYGTLLVPPALATFVAHFPCIQIEMQTGLTAAMTERLGENFDLVIAMHPQGQGGGTFLRREQAAWAVGATHSALSLSPLPVALYPQGCLFRQWAMTALDAAGVPWRLAFVNHSLGAAEAIAAAGLAVTVVKAGTCPSSLRMLGADDGLPGLPAADIRLHLSEEPTPAASALARHLVAALAKEEPQ
ncbi:LysR substrate-binding domain-containing protein [Bosea psychrotolerans]|uniref:LysR family transcriptional regulator n=1 Tax=Bosea psychrotolerans TaxID=1871628 RepID=A0A2S4MLM5_9HYPH|nr:LysR family transcriptional regulator [Bosea psychrotolerans]POR55499.1 LysR family transcriptional regulator [Bosea psychrotolerans]